MIDFLDSPSNCIERWWTSVPFHQQYIPEVLLVFLLNLNNYPGVSFSNPGVSDV